jgi:hypothetical protein
MGGEGGREWERGGEERKVISNLVFQGKIIFRNPYV